MRNPLSLLRSRIPAPLADLLRSLKHAGRQLPRHRLYQQRVRGKRGIEIGGPSLAFRFALPLYPCIADLDGVNFAARTVWEGQISAGRTFAYRRGRLGQQYIAEATDLPAIPAGAYEFVLSSNCLEHVANPVRALLEWRRILQPRGTLVLVLPRRESNFDHRRPVTTFQHLLDDFQGGVTEADLTHLEEILRLHDLSRDPEAGTAEQFRARSLENHSNRTLHHHVFDEGLISQLLGHTGFHQLDASSTATDWFALAEKVG